MGKLGKPTDLGEAMRVAGMVHWAVMDLPQVKEVLVGGSVRRGCKEVSDVDLLVVTDPPGMEMDGLWPTEFNIRWTPRGGTVTVDDVRVELYSAPADATGAALLFLTGPGSLNVYMRTKAKQYGWRLSQYGLVENATVRAARVDVPTGDVEEDERQIMRLLGVPELTPEEREDWQRQVRR